MGLGGSDCYSLCNLMICTVPIWLCKWQESFVLILLFIRLKSCLLCDETAKYIYSCHQHSRLEQIKNKKWCCLPRRRANTHFAHHLEGRSYHSDLEQNSFLRRKYFTQPIKINWTELNLISKQLHSNVAGKFLCGWNYFLTVLKRSVISKM